MGWLARLVGTILLLPGFHGSWVFRSHGKRGYVRLPWSWFHRSKKVGERARVCCRVDSGEEWTHWGNRDSGLVLCFLCTVLRTDKMGVYAADLLWWCACDGRGLACTNLSFAHRAILSDFCDLFFLMWVSGGYYTWVVGDSCQRPCSWQHGRVPRHCPSSACPRPPSSVPRHTIYFLYLHGQYCGFHTVYTLALSRLGHHSLPGSTSTPVAVPPFVMAVSPFPPQQRTRRMRTYDCKGWLRDRLSTYAYIVRRPSMSRLGQCHISSKVKRQEAYTWTLAMSGLQPVYTQYFACTWMALHPVLELPWVCRHGRIPRYNTVRPVNSEH
jgi:hypothetical protein